jgi:hypothetical protein
MEAFNDVLTCLNAVIDRIEAIPLLIGLSRNAEDALDELQETSFKILTALLFACGKNKQVRDGMQPLLAKMLEAVKNHMEAAHYKCERPSAENLSEFIAKLV